MTDKSLVLNEKHLTIALLILAFMVRWVVLLNHGTSLTLNSDDTGYVRSAINLLSSGKLTYHDPNEATVHIMPGMTFIISFVFLFFGSGTIGLYIVKLLFVFIGVMSVYGTKLLGEYFSKRKTVGYISALILALYVPQILTDNLLLTETPFTMFFIFCIYFTLKYFDTRKRSDLVALTLLYICCLYLRPTIALYPAILFLFLLFRKFPVKLIFKHALISGGIVLICVMPWWVRNFVVFDEFIPLSGGAGNPLLLGTFQGIGYPAEKDLETIVRELDEKEHLSWYNRFKEEESIAKDRLNHWWTKDRSAFLYSFLVLKPKLMWEYAFYWIEIYDFKANTIHKIHQTLLLLFSLGVVYNLFKNKQIRFHIFFIISILLYFTISYSSFYAFNRYNHSLMPIIIIGAAILLVNFVDLSKKFIRVKL